MPIRYCFLVLAAAMLANGDSLTLDLNAFGIAQTPMTLGDYFNGGYGNGAGGLAVGPGPDYGITGIPDELWVYSTPGAPGGQNDALSAPLHGGRPLFVANGFTDRISFYFSGGELDPSNPNRDPYFTMDVLDKTGNILAEKNIGYEDSWTPFTMSFTGTAYTVDFGSASNNMGDFRFSGITLANSDTANPPGSETPEPSSYGLLGLGILSLAWKRKKSGL